MLTIFGNSNYITTVTIKCIQNLNLIQLYFSVVGNSFWAKYKTPHKDPASSETRDYMTERLTYEYEFYYYIKQRFYTQLYLIKQRLNNQNSNTINL